jgi:hypothetical protein
MNTKDHALLAALLLTTADLWYSIMTPSTTSKLSVRDRGRPRGAVSMPPRSALSRAAPPIGGNGALLPRRSAGRS